MGEENIQLAITLILKGGSENAGSIYLLGGR